MMRSIHSAPVVACALHAFAPLAHAADPPGIVLARVAAPTQVAARDGVAVWGAYSAPQRWFTLTKRTFAGRIAPVGVLPINAATQDTGNGTQRTEPTTFEVTLGRDAQNRLTAVYPRCITSERKTCKLALATLATGKEQTVDGTDGALRGAISGSRLVWVAGTPGGPDRLYARHNSSGRPALLALPSNARIDTGYGAIDRASIRISAVDIRRRDIAYVLDAGYVGDPIAESQIWLDRSQARLSRVARVGTGGGSSGFRQFIGPRLYQRDVVAYMQGRDQVNAVVRYSLGGRVLGSASIGIRSFGFEPDISGGTFDRARFIFSTAPYQGVGCADFEGNPPGATCPILDSGPLTLNPPAPRRR